MATSRSFSTPYRWSTPPSKNSINRIRIRPGFLLESGLFVLVDLILQVAAQEADHTNDRLVLVLCTKSVPTFLIQLDFNR